MLIKAGVDISRLKPPIRKRLTELAFWYASGKQELVITSTYEGNHSAGSLHYADLAVDVRPPDPVPLLITKQWGHIFSRDYDIVVKKDHIHIEYDPKGS